MPPRVALAFESGGGAEACAATLTALREADVRATVFLDGRWADASPDLLAAMADDGHEFGNHAYSHPDLTALPDGRIAEELERTEALAVARTGKSTRPWFRPPFQRLDDRVRRVAASLGFRALSRDALDGARYPGPSTPEAILARSLTRAVDGAVLTYHLHARATARVLGEIVAGLRARGAAPGTVSDLPSPPPERASVHPDFVDLAIEPGYLRMDRPAPPPQVVNLLQLGADALAPDGAPMPLGRVASGEVTLLVVGPDGCAPAPAAGERQVVCLAGAVAVAVRDAAGRPLCTIAARPGDAAALPAGARATLSPERRAVVLLIG